MKTFCFFHEAIPPDTRGMASLFHQWIARQAQRAHRSRRRSSQHLLQRGVFGLALSLCLQSATFAQSFAAQSSAQPQNQPIADLRESLVPPESVIWWRFNPTPLSATAPDAPAAPIELASNLNSRLGSAILRAAVASKVVPSDTVARVLEVALAAGEAGAVPHTFAVLELSENAGAAGPAALGTRPRSRTSDTKFELHAVLDLQTSSGHQGLVRTIEAILVDPNLPQERRGTQRIFKLPPGGNGSGGVTPERTVAAFRRSDWSDSLEVSWCSTPGHFTVAVGVGVMERWFAVQDAGTPAPMDAGAELDTSPRREAEAHRRFMERLRSPETLPGAPQSAQKTGQSPTQVFEFFMDCNSLRRSMDASFTSSLKPETEGHGARLLRSWSLSNARSFMLHFRAIAPEHVMVASGPEDLPALLDPARTRVVYEGPPLLVMDATWSSRSNGVGEISHRTVSEPFWPQKDLGKPPPGRFVMVFPSDISSLLNVTTGFYGGLVAPEDARKRDRDASSWRHSMSSIIQRQQRRLGKWIVLIGPESSGGSLLADLAVFCQLDARADHRQFDTDLLALLTPFKDAIHAPDSDNVRTLSADSLGAINLAAWTTLPRDKEYPGTFVSALGFGVTQDAAKARVKRIADWIARGRQTP